MKKVFLVLCLVLFGAGFSLDAAGFDRVDDLKKQARRGNAEAQLKLGQRYFNGDGVLKNPGRAAYWIKQAHENGAAEAGKVWDRLELWQYQVDRDKGSETGLTEKPESEIYVEPVTGMEFVWIEQGCFQMPDRESSGGEESRVCLDGFWMGKYEVTQKEYAKITGTYPSGYGGDENRPVESVTWDEAAAFAEKLNSKNPRTQGFALPTRAQWMYACSGGSENNDFPWGDSVDNPSANCGTCAVGSYRGRTAPVGSFAPNRFGLYDMAGNVQEWSKTRHEKGGRKRIALGGGFTSNLDDISCASKKRYLSSMKSRAVGIRLVKTD
ncbi:MAG: SUMF1/EgtB/PvdO family nonheme iron enzyme [Desulfobacteraceae bacterium]